MTSSPASYRERVIREYEEERLRRGVEFGECFCGCKRKTTLAIATRFKEDFLKDHPHRFLPGHRVKKPHKVSPKEICPSCGERKNVAAGVCRKCYNVPERTDETEYILDGQPCRKIPLTHGQVAIVDADDYPRLANRSWSARWHPRTKSYYAVSAPDEDGYCMMHRAVMRAPKGVTVDHRSPSQTLDNRKRNLRFSNELTNSWNRRPWKSSKSGYKGVSPKKGSSKWVVQIQVAGKKIWLAHSDTPEEGARIYDRAAIHYFGDFAYLNFPKSDYS